MKWWTFIGILLGILLLAIFIYTRVYPIGREGFATAPVVNATEFDISSNGVYSAYTIFDPSAFYTQLEIAKTDYPVMANTLIQIETLNAAQAEGRTVADPEIPPVAVSLYTLLGTKATGIKASVANDPSRLTQGYSYLASITGDTLKGAVGTDATAFSAVFNPSTVPASAAAVAAATTAFNTSVGVQAFTTVSAYQTAINAAALAAYNAAVAQGATPSAAWVAAQNAVTASATDPSRLPPTGATISATMPASVQTAIAAAIPVAPTEAQLATLKGIWTQGVLNPVGSQYLANKPDLRTFNLQAIQNIDTYYTNLLNTFEVHPVRFIAAGYSKGPSNLNCIPNGNGVTCLRHQSTIEGTYGISTVALTNPSAWRINPMFTPASAAIATQFSGTRRNPANLLYSPVAVKGEMTPKNLQEIRDSISLTIPFNFIDPAVINSQVRIMPSPPYTLQTCPTFNGRTEWGQGSTLTKVNGVDTITLITALIPTAKVFNDAVFTRTLDPATLKLLPTLCKQYILEWAAGRKAAIMAFDKKTPTVADLTFDTSPPIFNLLNSIPAGTMVSGTVTYPTPRTYLIPSEIHAILDKAAQVHYANSQLGEKMNTIYDVYQVGDTIFDIRYSVVISQSNEEYAKQLSTLKGEYAAYSQQSLSEAELTQLDVNYTTQLSQALAKTTGNTLGTATNCGRLAQYVRVTRITTTIPSIQLSQIVVVNNSGNNIAFGSLVIVKSTKLFDQDDTANHVYSLNPTINAQIVLNTITTAIQAKSALLIDGTYTPRAAPFVYNSMTNETTEYVELKLTSPSDISVVQLIPALLSTGDGYSVQLYDSNRVTIGTPVAATATTPGSSTVTANFIKTPRPVNVVACPTSMLETHKVARFYATIASDYPPAGLQKPDISKIKFTGFSEGLNAALSFNPKYNGGFPVSITSSEGNLVYKPKVDYTYTAQQKLSASSLDCTQKPVLLQIMNDYRRNVKSRGFMARADVLAIPFPNNYENTHTYYPTRVVASVQLTPLSCGIQWTEIAVNVTTNVRKPDITRFGKFVYATNTTNPNFSDTYYDVSNSIIYPTVAAYNTANSQKPLVPLTTPIPIQTPYPTSYTLDTANGFCPATDCSDPNVITQLVNAYNTDALAATPPLAPILIVNKAVTVNANQCQFGVIKGGSTYTNDTFNFPLLVSYSPASTMCLYKPTRDPQGRIIGGGGGQGTSIVPSVPLLSNPYSYVVQMAKPYTDTITKNVSSLISFVSPVKSELNAVIKQYRTDSYAAFGQIQSLHGCDASENILNKCNSATVMDRFLTYYNNRNWNTSRLNSILRAGTYSSNQCDFTVSAAPPSLPGSPANPGQTLGFRCIMRPPLVGEPCVFDVSECAPWAPQPPLESIMDVSGYKPTVASMDASDTVTYPLATGGTTTASMLTPDKGQPYMNTSFTSPIHWIDCTSTYALKEMARATGGALSVTSVANKGVNTCIVNGTNSYTFQKISNLLTSLAPTAAGTGGTGTVTNFNPPINAATLTTTRPATCGFPTGFPSAMERVSGLQTILQGINVDSSTTREYRVNASDFLPFSVTHVRVSYYNGSSPRHDSTECANIHVNTFAASTEATSPFTYFNNGAKASAGASILLTTGSVPLVNRPFSAITATTIVPFITAFNKAWALENTSVTSNPKKYIGPIQSYAYNAANDSIVFKVEKSVHFGPYGSTDVREVYTPCYISVVYRVLTNTSPTTPTFTPGAFSANPLTFVFSMTESSTLPAANLSFAPYTDGAWKNDTNYAINSDTTNYGITRIEDGLRSNQFRLLRFTINGTPTPQSHGEVTRMMFYSSFDTKGNTITPTIITLPNPAITVADISANYVKPADTSILCDRGYTTSSTPDSAGNTICSVPAKVYTKPSGTACGIGFLEMTPTSCSSTAIFNAVLENPETLGNTASAGVPRLRLAYGQTFLITLDSQIQVDGFSFITGSAATIPKSFTLEGSVNGITWKTLVNPTNLNYDALGPRVRRSPGVPDTPVLSFFYPGLFVFPTTGAATTTPSSTTPTQFPFYESQIGNITEGFVSAPPPPERVIRPTSRATPVHTVSEELELGRSYDLPLRVNRPTHMYTKQAASAPHPIGFNHRIRYLRFRTIATVDPASKFVSMSQFTMHTRNGTIAPELLTFSNLEGSRKHASEGPQSLAATTNSKRWVDYNKSQLIVQLDTDRLPREPITGFQFHVPNFPGALASVPARWTLEGSNDGRSWIPLHEMKSPARFLAEFSPVYTFSQEI